MTSRRCLRLSAAVATALVLAACEGASSDPEGPLTTGASDSVANKCEPAAQMPTGRIAYTHYAEDGATAIYLMDPDGSNAVCLVDTAGNDFAAAWSPDGTQVVFNSDAAGDQDLYVVNADGSGLGSLLVAPGDQGLAGWSPDGETILYVEYAEVLMDSPGVIRSVGVDGEGAKTLIASGEPFPYVDEPRWSPTGERVLFLADRGGGWRDLLTMRPDGSQVKVLLERESGLDGGGIAWSPDGTRIAFQSDLDGGCIYQINADGTGLRKLTSGCVEGLGITWSPDGTRIAWGATDNGPADAYVMNADGSNHVAIVDSADAAFLAWQPV